MTKKSKKTIEQAFNKRRAEIAKRMHIAVVDGGFYIIEIPGSDGEPFTIWSNRFASKRAAELFLVNLLDAYADGDMQLCGALSDLHDYDGHARVLEFLEKRENIADLNALACDLVEFRPWLNRRPGSSGDPSSSSGDMDSEIPF